MASQQTPKIIMPHLNWSLARLKEVIEKEDTEYYRGAALQRFTLTYEITLKAIRAFAEHEGKSFSTDKLCFQWIEKIKWVEKKTDWDSLIKNYNKIKKFPEENSTGNTYRNLPKHYTIFKNIKESMNLALNKIL